MTVTALPLTVSAPFHSWVIDCPLGSVQRTVHPFMVADAALVTVTPAWKPPLQLLVIVYVAVQPVPVPVGLGDRDGDGDGLELGDGGVDTAEVLGDGLGPDPPMIR